jgi:dephospho-CoA kinase
MVESSRRLQRWVLTGPIGAGKSRAAATLAALGAQVIDADAEGHRLLREPEVVAAIKEAFGVDTVVEGVIDRAALGRRVFADPGDLDRLNAITHGRLSARIAERLETLEAEAREPGLAVVEAAVYFQLPPFGPVDLVVAVTAPPEQRFARLVASGRFEAPAANARVEGQAGMLADFDRADVILDNTGDAAALERAVVELYRIHVIEADPGG